LHIKLGLNIHQVHSEFCLIPMKHFRLRPGLPIYALDIDSIKANWKLIIDKGAKMIYPGHGNPFPVEVMKKILN
jgi:hypothetical protein